MARPADHSSTSRATAKRGKPPRQRIPIDDEPITPEDLREIKSSEAAFARGDYVTLEELRADVARLRSREASKESPAPFGRRSRAASRCVVRS